MPSLRTRWRLFLGVATLGLIAWLGILSGYQAWTNRQGCVSLTNYARLQKGMTQTDVETLFGAVGAPHPAEASFLRAYQLDRPGMQIRLWNAEGLQIEVVFDAEGRVVIYFCRRESPLAWWEQLLNQYGF